MSNRAHRRPRPMQHAPRCSAGDCRKRAWIFPGDVVGLRFEGVPLPPLCLDHSDEVMAKLAVEDIRNGGDGLDGYRRWRERAGLDPMDLTERLAGIDW